MHGSTGGRWRSCVHGATEPTHPAGKPAGLSPSDLPTADQPAAYLTVRAWYGAVVARSPHVVALSPRPAAEALESDLAQLLVLRGSEALPYGLPAYSEGLTDLIPRSAFAARCLGCRPLDGIEVTLELGGSPEHFQRVRVATVDQSVPRFPGREFLTHICQGGLTNVDCQGLLTRHRHRLGTAAWGCLPPAAISTESPRRCTLDTVSGVGELPARLIATHAPFV